MKYAWVYLLGVLTPYLGFFLYACYKRVREEFKRVRDLDEKDANRKVVGKIDSIEEDEEGIKVTGIIFDKETLAKMHAGSLSSMSIGYSLAPDAKVSIHPDAKFVEYPEPVKRRSDDVFFAEDRQFVRDAQIRDALLNRCRYIWDPNVEDWMCFNHSSVSGYNVKYQFSILPCKEFEKQNKV